MAASICSSRTARIASLSVAGRGGDLQARFRPGQVAQGSVQDVLHGRRDAQCQVPVTPVGTLDLVAGAFGSGQQDVGVFEQHLPGRGEEHVARAALEQGDVQVPFQGLDLLGQRGRGDVEPAGGPPEVPFLGHSKEVLELSELHTSHVSP